MPSDFKDPPQIKDPTVFGRLHRRWRECALAEDEALAPEGCWRGQLSLHHVLPKGSPHFGDDVEENLVMLCGSGTTGHHGAVEGAEGYACSALGRHLLARRPDTISYLIGKLGEEAALAWLERHLDVREAP